MKLQKFIKTIEELDLVESVCGDLIPTPSTSAVLSNYLYIKCVYATPSADEAPAETLAKWRSVAQQIFQHASMQLTSHNYESLVLSFYDFVGAEERRRLYRAVIKKAKLFQTVSESFCDFVEHEESSYEKTKEHLMMERGGRNGSVDEF